MSEQIARPVINLDEVQIGAWLPGYNFTAVPPGKRAFALRHHHANMGVHIGEVGESVDYREGE